MPFRNPGPGAAVLARISAAGCAVGPDCKRPEIDAPVSVTAASENLSIRTAAARPAEAGARLGLAEAAATLFKALGGEWSREP